jgi:ABC-type Fe3+-hydroxamate transport system substrate-binding protein
MTKTLNRRETVLALDQLGLPSYATDPRTVESVLASFQRLGELIGERDTGQRLAESLRSRLDDVKRRIGTRSPRRALFVVWLEPFITIGRDTFIADALRYAGAESVISTAQDWPHISLEEVVRLQPEYLIFATSREESVMQHFKELTALPGWRSLDAVRNKRMAIISDAIDRPSPRIVGAIEELAHQLHPKAFKDAEGAHDTRARNLQLRPAGFRTLLRGAIPRPGACRSCAL